MFISESYIHYQDDLSHTAGYDAEEFVDISFDLHPLRRNSNVGVKSKYLSKSADLVYRSRIPSSTNGGYEGDSDSDSSSVCTSPENTSVHTHCEICNLDFIHGVLDDTKQQQQQQQPQQRHRETGTTRRKTRQRRRRNSFSYDVFANSMRRNIDFDQYKDEQHRMEVFAPDSEKKWTLQYEYNRERDEKKLTKVIIGRGQNDDYPELNNIHLIGRNYYCSHACLWMVIYSLL